MSLTELVESLDATAHLECRRTEDGIRLEVTNPPLGAGRRTVGTLLLVAGLGALSWLLHPFLETSDGNAAVPLALLFGALILLLMMAEIYTRRRLGKDIAFTGDELIVEHNDVINHVNRIRFRPDRVVVQSTWPLLRSGIQVFDSRQGKKYYIAGAAPYHQRFTAGRQLASFFNADFDPARPLTDFETELLEGMTNDASESPIGRSDER